MNTLYFSWLMLPIFPCFSPEAQPSIVEGTPVRLYFVVENNPYVRPIYNEEDYEPYTHHFLPDDGTQEAYCCDESTGQVE